MISESGLVKGVFEKVPPEYAQVSVSDYGECLIIPGLTDLHVHAPQYTFRAMGMDMELLEWLETNTFPEEAKYQDLEYARRAYRIFTDNLKRSVTTRACIFGTIHRDATLLLMDQLEQSGLVTYGGKSEYGSQLSGLSQRGIGRRIRDSDSGMDQGCIA